MTEQQIERRFLPLDGLDLRAVDGGHELDGYAAVFNTEAVIWGLWREEVAPGAYAKTLQENDIRALWNHDSSVVLGRNKAGTLTLQEDGHGLRTVIHPPDNEWGRPVLDAVSRGDVTGMSIAFRVIKEQWSHPPEDSQELPKRTIREAKLYEVSPVTFPAFESTSISARSGDGIEGGGEVDVLERARILVRCAQRGMPLTQGERALIAEAREILAASIPTAEPEGGAGAPHHHSDGEPEGDVGTSLHHSAARRARELELLEIALI